MRKTGEITIRIIEFVKNHGPISTREISKILKIDVYRVIQTINNHKDEFSRNSTKPYLWSVNNNISSSLGDDNLLLIRELTERLRYEQIKNLDLESKFKKLRLENSNLRSKISKIREALLC